MSRAFPRGVVSVAAGSALALSLLSPTAGAGAAGGALGLRAGSPGITDSTNWSGYAATGATFTRVAAKWVEPKASCPRSNAVAALWVGLDGFTSRTVEQDGSIAACNGATAAYYIWWEMYPSNSIQVVARVHSGDAISALVSYAAGNYTLSVTDTTSGQHFTKVASCASCRRSSAETILEAPSDNSGVLPLADFGTATFSANAVATASSSGGYTGFSHTGINMIKENGNGLKARIGPLGASGSSFSDAWLAAGP